MTQRVQICNWCERATTDYTTFKPLCEICSTRIDCLAKEKCSELHYICNSHYGALSIYHRENNEVILKVRGN